MIRELLLISGGGVLGTCARYAVVMLSETYFGKMFFFGTLTVNVLGGLVAGFLFAIFAPCESMKDYRLFCFVGFLGAFTTFSAYSLETINLFLADKFRLGLLNILLNNALALGMVVVGIWLAKFFVIKH